MAKKEKNQRNHRAHEAWVERKQEINAGIEFKTAQKMYRRACLKQREAEGRLTEKNRTEMERLGMAATA